MSTPGRAAQVAGSGTSKASRLYANDAITKLRPEIMKRWRLISEPKGCSRTSSAELCPGRHAPPRPAPSACRVLRHDTTHARAAAAAAATAAAAAAAAGTLGRLGGRGCSSDSLNHCSLPQPQQELLPLFVGGEKYSSYRARKYRRARGLGHLSLKRLV